MSKIIVVSLLFALALFLELFEVKWSSKPYVKFRKGDVSRYILGCIIASIGILVQVWW